MIDLHTHTINSDGDFTTCEILRNSYTRISDISPTYRRWGLPTQEL